MNSIKMFKLTLSLILFVSDSFCTRLPLEVFEMPSTLSSAAALTSSSSSTPSVVTPPAASSATTTTTHNLSNNNPNSNYNSKPKSIYNHHMDRRRSRQMLDVLQQHRTRILYQVGESEDDLPICAPNAVCSKIDLYETPWIERQCRCPDNAYGGVMATTHRKESHLNVDKFQAAAPFYEIDNSLPQKHRILISNENKLESLHMKKLIAKLGAVYKDDILVEDSEEISNNAYDLPEVQKRRQHYSKAAHLMRHGGGHKGKDKDIPHIGGCPSSLGTDDGHTIADKTRHYKLCNPVHKLPLCRYFRDYTWTLSTSPEMNVTEQIVHCRCPRNSVTYLTKREPREGLGYTYLFACSPQTRLRCQRKEPCKLFTVRKRQEFLDEVNTNSLCQCPKGHRCPRHHTDAAVIAGDSFVEDNIQTYSGYCMAND